MKIIGYRRSDFVTKEGRPVTGCRIYLATEIASQNGEGVFVRDMYLSDAKMAELKINLHDLMGREVKIFYNEYREVNQSTPIQHLENFITTSVRYGLKAATQVWS